MQKKFKRELIEWSVIVSVAAGLYFSGYHTEVLGFIQRGVIATGLFTPSLDQDRTKTADYIFELEDHQGASLNAADLTGKVVFINLWATWCPPCIAEMPDINSLYQRRNDEVVFLMISMDDDFDKAKRFLEKKGFDFPVYQLTTRLPEVFRSQSIPTSYVLSKGGEIAMTRKGLAKYDTDSFNSFLDELLSE
ncbi:MAG: thiol-disulfide isomerase/thioredoxin [Cyclobacteriaceae bacterium]|jgi:thiol-disulfide isomerase/thioredoxin